MTTPLTKKQKNILDFIKSFQEKNDYSPTLEEIGKRFKLSSKATVHQYLSALDQKGHIKQNKGYARSIELTEIKTVIEIPLLGTITAGAPIDAIEVPDETISVAKNELSSSGKHYALRVKGDSMIDEGIFDGDTVIIKKQKTAENGQTVVAIVDDNLATLKKIYKEKDRVRLQPMNQAMLPFYKTEVEVRGVVINIVRNFTETVEKFKTLDLFAGIGGIRLGFEKAGFETVFANDFEKQCKKTYDLNFKISKLITEDLRKLNTDDLPEFDFLLAGFPCQAFSVAGYREGFNDKKDRGNLFFDIAKIIEKRKPTGFLLENVKNLKNHDDGKTFEIIEKTLKDLGYHIKTKILNSMEYGNVPQNRERIYIVGFRDKNYYENFDFPNKQRLSIKIDNLLEKDVSQKYYYNDKPLFEKLKNYSFKKGIVYQWRRKYVRENKSGVCPTLTANMGTGGHNVPIIKDTEGIRKLTPRECARIQGFPDSYKLPEIADSVLYKQLGNSVSVTVVEKIAKEIKKALI